MKAWRGEHESIREALMDVTAVLEGCGRVLVDGERGVTSGRWRLSMMRFLGKSRGW